MTQLQERFDKWAYCPADDRYYDTSKFDNDEYEDIDTMNAWLAWQASARDQMEKDALIVKDYSFGNASDAIRESFEREAGRES